MLIGVVIVFILFTLWCMLKVSKMADEIVFDTQNIHLK